MGRTKVYRRVGHSLRMARVPYLTQDDLPAEHRHLFETDPDDPADVVVRIHRALANNPRLFAAWADWVATIYDEVADARLRELVILTVADAGDCAYVWHQHVPLARAVGIEDGEILAIHEGRFEGLPAEERAAIAYANAHATNDVTDEIHERLRDHFDDGEIVTIGLLASEYERALGVIDALSVELEGPFVGWRLDGEAP